MSRQPTYQVRALERGLDILDAFSQSDPELSLSEIADRANLVKSTAVRLLSVLEARGYVERSPETELYRLGVRVFEAGNVFSQTTSLEAEAQPILDRIATQCNQTANLAILSDGEVVHTVVVPPIRPIRFWAPPGTRESVHCTGLGKVLIAALPQHAIELIAQQHGLPARTRRTVTTIEELSLELSRVRENGYALDDEESEVGLRCVAVPVRDQHDRVAAAISVSGPANEFNEHEILQYAAILQNGAQELSARLGNSRQRIQIESSSAPPADK